MSDELPPPLDVPFALPSGIRLGSFEIRSVLGVGGFGVVYRAFENSLNREVAIKEYMPRAFASRRGVAQVSVFDRASFDAGLSSFVNEARLLAGFDHPSLPRVYRFWEDNGTAYMAMPVLEGPTLKQLRQEMVRPPDEAWLRGLLMPLLSALEALHDREIFHRDIAPDNIVMAVDGRPVLIDFGAARRLPGDRSEEITTIYKQSYSPPEQLNEVTEAASIGPWTDLFALGGTLHFLLLNRPPKPASARLSGGVYLPLADQQLPGCSPEFLAIVDNMLALSPAARPQSVDRLRAALQSSAAMPMTSEPRPPGGQNGRWRRLATLLPLQALSLQGRSKQVGVSVSVAALLALSASMLIGYFGAPPSTAEPLTQVEVPVNASVAPVSVAPLPAAQASASSDARGSVGQSAEAAIPAAPRDGLPAHEPTRPNRQPGASVQAAPASPRRTTPGSQAQGPSAAESPTKAPAGATSSLPVVKEQPELSGSQQTPSRPNEPVATPKAVCGGLGFFQQMACMDAQCRTTQQAASPDCQEWYRKARDSNSNQ